MKVMHNMDYECKQPSDADLAAYKAFMYNPDNEYNCSECPERDCSNNDYGLPCGQQNCWVTCHCRLL